MHLGVDTNCIVGNLVALQRFKVGSRVLIQHGNVTVNEKYISTWHICLFMFQKIGYNLIIFKMLTYHFNVDTSWKSLASLLVLVRVKWHSLLYIFNDSWQLYPTMTSNAEKTHFGHNCSLLLNLPKNINYSKFSW